MNVREMVLARAVVTAQPCPEHGEQACLYGCQHSRRDECEACALIAAQAVEAALANLALCDREGCVDNRMQESSVHCPRCGRYLGYRDLSTGGLIGRDPLPAE